MTHKSSQDSKNYIAITGMGCIFPESRNLKEYWHLLFNCIDAVTTVPEDTHWKTQDYYDPDPAAPDRTYCRRGGFLPVTAFDPLKYSMPPNNLEATDTSQLLGLEVAGMALEDAGYPPGHPALAEKRVNVILGVTGTQELVIPLGARLSHPLWKKALEDSGIREDKKNEIIQRIQAGYTQWQENSFPGLLGNVIPGRIANRLNLSGTNLAVDAACASSLSAIHTAILELMAGRCDISVTGGVDTLNDIFMHMCFSKTGVLSHTSDIRPFSKDADGTVLGEGIGMLILKRLNDAQKDNDRIYAVIRATGTSSDGRTPAVYAPDSQGQVMALKQAYELAGVDTSTVGLIEAHGTGTRVGDKVEFEALKQCFSPDSGLNRTAIGSVKSMIGHTKAAAGAAGIIKAALSLYNKVIPPTLKADDPDPELDINNSAFYISTRPKPWAAASGFPRRAGVSAFGFGGSNFHIVLEEYNKEKDHVSWDGSVQIMAFSSDSRQGISEQIKKCSQIIHNAGQSLQTHEAIAWQACESRRNFSHSHEFRLCLVHERGKDIENQLEKAREVLMQGTENPGIHFAHGRPDGKIGFLFPGQGSQYTDMGKDIIATFPEALKALDLGNEIFRKEHADNDCAALSSYIFPPPAHVQKKDISESKLRQTQIAQPAIGVVSLAMIKILKRFGIVPDAACGHSFGELAALYAAGWIDEKTLLTLSVKRGRYMAQAGSGIDDPGSMLAVQAEIRQIEDILRQENLDLVLANRNSPSQGVLSGPTNQILAAKKILKTRRIRSIKLPVAAAFHSRLVENALEPFNDFLSEQKFTPTDIRVFSNTTGKPYPDDPDRIRKILSSQLVNPVDFISNIRGMASENIKMFIEAGPKSVLAGLTKSILDTDKTAIISLDSSAGRKSGIRDLADALCIIAAKGFKVDLTQWEDPADRPVSKKMAVPVSGANIKPKNPAEIIPAPSDKPLKKTSSSGSDMKSHTEHNHAPSQPAGHNPTHAGHEAMKLIQKGFEAIQKLQEQTARAHEKFLDTQAQAGRTLAAIMEQSRGNGSAEPAPIMMAQNSAPMPEPAPAPAPEPALRSAPEPVPVHVPEPVQVHTPGPEHTIEDNPAPAMEQEQSGQADSRMKHAVFEIVSRLTGFPEEMLEPDMDIESDLGIDSIKKVEIISELEKAMPSCRGLNPDQMGSVRTLNDLCLSLGNDTCDTNSAPADTEAVVSTRPSNDVSEAVFNTISELTGFPVEMLEPSMNLESDLGIDSIKRVEILAKLEQEPDCAMNVPADDLSGLQTIGQIISALTGKEPDPDRGDSTLEKKTPEPEPVTESPEIKQSGQKKNLERQAVVLKKYPINQIRFFNGSRIELPETRKVYVTRDSSGIAERFRDEFSSLGIKAQLIDITEDIPLLDDAGGIVLVPDTFKDNTQKAGLNFLKSCFLLAKKNANFLIESAKEKGAFLTGISFLGGGFGFAGYNCESDPCFGGLAGLVKTAALEWDNVLCHVLDMPFDPELCLANAEPASALMMTHGPVEMGLDNDSCNIPELVARPVQTRMPELGRNDVIVITGGAKGVTASCAIEIARAFSPVIVLLGRSKADFSEPDWARGLDDPGRLKKAIMTNMSASTRPNPADIQKIYNDIVSGRQIRDNIALMEKHGARVRYFSADIRDSSAVEQIFIQVRKEFSSISGIIHGAGILKDKLIVDKHPDQFSRVLETKVKGLDALLSASAHDRLKFFIMFSSIAARTGNKGQCDYAAANEILNKTAAKLAYKNTECRYLAINWGPWEGGMVNDSLKKQFTKKGISLIPLKQGAQFLINELACTNETDAEIVIGAHLLPPEKSKKPVMSEAIQISLGRSSAPVLESHKIAGTPVVPFALLMEFHAKAAEKNNPGLVFAGMDDMRLLKGIKPADEEIRIKVNLAKCTIENNGFTTLSTISSENGTEDSFLHSRCTVLLKDRLPDPPVLSKAAFMELAPCSITPELAYEKILFHGRDLQCITSINGYSDKGIEIAAKPGSTPRQWLGNGFSEKWTTQPMMLDAAFQAAIIWSYKKTGHACLPGYIANFRVYSSFSHLDEAIRIIFTVNELTRHSLKGYFTFLNQDKTVVASITGFEAAISPDLAEKFRPGPLFSKESILEFAQGMPSKAFGEKYSIFDRKRKIARLPRPPYFFMDRVIKADHPQWEMTAAGWIETEYDIPENAWYFRANKTSTMPLCILLEIALQPCGWLAAYAGSALAAEQRLYFRNLGGRAELTRSLSKNSGKVIVKVRMTDVSMAGSMIIQNFDMQVLNQGSMVYKGTTNFGFFTADALANQVGIRNTRFNKYILPEEMAEDCVSFSFEDEPPLVPEDDDSPVMAANMPSTALRMIDKIQIMNFKAGLYSNGYIMATKQVRPEEWFFNAHFYQDPVCPGSLGIESFLQMIRFFLSEKFDIDPGQYQAVMSSDQTHEWIYRGQIIPSNNQVKIHAHIKDCTRTDHGFHASADGALEVDGICIYEMENFSVSFIRAGHDKAAGRYKTDMSEQTRDTGHK